MATVCFRVLALVGMVLVTHSPFSFAQAADSVETVERAAADWARLRDETIRIESEWTWQEGTLRASLSALQDRIRGLEGEKSVLEAAVKAETTNTGVLFAESAAARETMEVVDGRVRTLAEKLLALRPGLPPRLSLALDLPFRSIADSTLGASERMQYVMTIFNRSAQFNKAISFAEEILSPQGDQNPRLLEVAYWGLSHAYALDRAGQTAYFGHPGPQGWQWEERRDITAAVTRLVAIHAEEADPAFVELPLDLDAAVPR